MSSDANTKVLLCTKQYQAMRAAVMAYSSAAFIWSVTHIASTQKTHVKQYHLSICPSNQVATLTNNRKTSLATAPNAPLSRNN
jgi:hypothetical protein